MVGAGYRGDRYVVEVQRQQLGGAAERIALALHDVHGYASAGELGGPIRDPRPAGRTERERQRQRGDRAGLGSGSAGDSRTARSTADDEREIREPTTAAYDAHRG